MKTNHVITNRVTTKGKFLFLTVDTELIQQQLDGLDIEQYQGLKLIDNISTDETTPGWTCFRYDEILGEYCSVGLRGGVITQGAMKKADADVLVAGESKGCGSSREHAPYSELLAGFKIVIAQSFEKIYAQNCRNIGLLLSTDFGLISRLINGEAIGIDEFCVGLDEIATDIVKMGGLFKYNVARLKGQMKVPTLPNVSRPMNIIEKIIAAHAVTGPQKVGVASVKAQDALFCQVDVRFSHDYCTAMVADLFYRHFGGEAKVKDVDNVYAFRDHLTFIDTVLRRDESKAHLIEFTDVLADKQRDFCTEQGITLYDEAPGGGSMAICHNAIVEDVALPGQIVIGTDSHTCTAGALGALAFGVGSTDMANAMLTKDVQVKVPAVVKVQLSGELAKGVAAKDAVLHMMTLTVFKSGAVLGKIIEYSGAGVKSLSLGERATLTNMAVEMGAMTAVVEADELVVEHLMKMRGLSREAIGHNLYRSDEDASYTHVVQLDLTTLLPTVATPGDPRNGITVAQLTEEQGKINIDIAYGGSCTGGKCEDMDMYASVFRAALDQGMKVHPQVECYIQFGSQLVKKYAQAQGYIALFEQVGATIIAPSCGACINAGPGVSFDKGQVSISAINRNFPGRSGPGQVYLASPYLIAASAVAGYISSVEQLLNQTNQ
ncbi:MAG: 3-isopropylmalate/(R)-2-methylmalate dehydratase large subunit [Phenylobacterium sp.]|jgi:3-isopropylmalate/(R)-2-methylmalate dehydratase large subunit